MLSLGRDLACKVTRVLTAKQQRFVEEYMLDLNGAQAAIRAGYSPRTAQEQSSRLLSNVKVAAAVAALKQDRSDRTGITADRVLQEMARIGLSDVRRLFTDAGYMRPVHSLGDDTAAAVASVEVVVRPSGGVDEDGNREVEHVHKIRLWDKNSALDKIARHLGMMAEAPALPQEHVHTHTHKLSDEARELLADIAKPE